MSAGTLTLALLALIPVGLPADVAPMNSLNFKIPISVAAGQRDKIKELLLFYSDDEGRTWHQTASAGPEKDAFVFSAPKDGLYWFNICVIDPQGNREPPDIYQSPPAQKVLVDTLKPAVRITSAQWQGDEIVVNWQIQEEHPDLATLKLEYHTPDAPVLLWYPAPVTQGLSGQSHFRVNQPGPVDLRMQMSDLAGNSGTAQTEVAARPFNTQVIAASAQTSGSVPALPPSSTTIPPVPAWPESAVSVPNRTSDRPPSFEPAALTTTTPRAVPEPAWGSQPAPAGPPARTFSADPGPRYLAPAPSTAGNTFGTSPTWTRSSNVPMQITNTTQVDLDYEVTKYGQSGIGSVELYVSQDDGRVWRRFADDPDCKPPMHVNLPGEGVYGLRLVVRSRAGLGGRAPQDGDLPQMRLKVDTTLPLVKLMPPQPDPRRHNALVLQWSCNDDDLALNPITLQWAERPDGPWQNIAADLANINHYTWQLASGMPFKVYLRVLARDQAGNVGVDETPEAVLIDMVEPEGQILGLVGRKQ
jgi:hypothetical protein